MEVGNVKVDLKNPTLKEYFQGTLTNFLKKTGKGLVIHFTQSNIRNIIIEDLHINLELFSELLINVFFDAFSVYVQEWPGWTNCEETAKQPEESYLQFKKYLRKQLLCLQEKEKDYVQQSVEYCQLSLKSQICLPKTYPKFVKLELPYSIHIKANAKLLPYISFEDVGNQCCVTIDKRNVGVRTDLTHIEAMNHPFVKVVFNIPDLIKFYRTNTHKTDQFLCKSTDGWMFKKDEHIIDVKRTPEKRFNVYSFNLLKELFSEMLEVAACYPSTIPEEIRNEVDAACSEFLSDIMQANLLGRTMQECVEITYNIGDCVYCADSVKLSGGTLNFRKVIFPRIDFGLSFCVLTENNIKPDGTFTYFDILRQDNSDFDSGASMEFNFVRMFNESISYTCELCVTNFVKIKDLKNHLLTVHPTSDILTCSECKSDFGFYEILGNRWKHGCPNKTVTPMSTPTN